MSVKAYVMIEAQAHWADEVIDEISGLPNVKSAYPVTGPYDGIAEVEVPDLAGLGTLVGDMNAIEGVTKTMTCIIMRFARSSPKIEKG